MTLSEPQLISPLLDGFVMGDPISSHDGVKCCPAMQLETGNKYIVKIISVPASQSKLDALLLAGAFADKDSALEYFQGLANGIADEAALLQRLSRFEGYVSYENWQIEPMESETGYDIYLLGEYRPTLDSLIKSNSMTHLAAVNLGLDLCAALSVARRFGQLYVDLQPTNIFICNEREYRIGDLGFVNLESLDYASLPDKYRSNYTPPEISDAYSALNTTMDTYAVGMILYQAYNDGRLPPIGIQMQPPRYADAELAEIILKACSIHPQQRWEDPMQMGQALISYLQRNSVNDVPIVPPVEEAEPSEDAPTEDEQPSTEDILAAVDEALDAAPALPLTAVPEEELVDDESTAQTESETDSDVPAEEISEQSEHSVESTDAAEAEPESGEAAIAADETIDELENESTCDAADSIAEEAQPESADEDAPAEEKEDDVGEILAQADDIISHQFATPTIELQPIEVAMPAESPVQEEIAAEAEPAEASVPEESEIDIPSEEEQTEKTAPAKKHRRGLIATIVTVSILILLLLGGVLFYEHYYLQTIDDIILSGSEDTLIVTLDTKIENNKLVILCTDTYGNTMRRQVNNNKATFEGLKAGTTYKLQVRIDGFHKLLGETAETYSTAIQTTIGNFVATTGSEDGSVILNFTVQGPPGTDQWKVRYQAAGEEPAEALCTGHTANLTGLTVGKEYTFTLIPTKELYLGGTESITYVPRKIVKAENLHILGIHQNALHVAWSAPENVEVTEWTVRCYVVNGYDQTITTTDTTACFEDIDPSCAYNIEVKAADMTVAETVYLSANSVTFHDITVEDQDRKSLLVKWDFEGTPPAEGWRLLYTVGTNPEKKLVTCTDTSAEIFPMIPGAHYSITILPADSTATITAFGGTKEYDAPEAPAFLGYDITAENIEFSMCITPDVENWDRFDVPQENYTTSFKVGSSASFVMHVNKWFIDTADDEITTLFVVRDRDGKIISNASEVRPWSAMWYKRYGKLTLPFLPTEPGEYTVCVYFNGTAATNIAFDVLPAEETQP